MSWTYYTNALGSNDLITEDQAAELWAAIMERRGAVGLSDTDTFPGLPSDVFWLRLSGAATSYINPQNGFKYNGTTNRFSDAILTALSISTFSTELNSAEYWNAVRIGCDLLRYRYLAGSAATRYARFGRAAGVSEAAGDHFFGENIYTTDAGETTYAASSSTAVSRFNADSTAPENNEQNLGSPGSNYGANYYTFGVNIPDVPSSGEYFHGVGLRLEQTKCTYTFPSSYLGEALDWYLTLRHNTANSGDSWVDMGEDYEETGRYSALDGFAYTGYTLETASPVTQVGVDGSYTDISSSLSSSYQLVQIASGYTKASGSTVDINFDVFQTPPTPTSGSSTGKKLSYHLEQFDLESLAVDINPLLTHTAALVL